MVFFILVFISYYLKLLNAAGFSLNAATVLLPLLSPESDPAFFDVHIRGEGGCFKVSNNRPDVINVNPIEFNNNINNNILNNNLINNINNNDCLKSVRINPSARAKSRDNAVLTFIDQLSGLILAAHVVVDKIDKLGFVSRRRVLYIGDNKETIEIIAYDSLGNIFNSLNNVIFNINIDCGGCGAHTPAAVANFHSSTFGAPEHILKLEARGLRGNLILIESLFKGDVKLNVKLIDNYYNISNFIILSIREYINIEPAQPQYLILRGLYRFKFFRLVRSAPQEINFNPALYKFTASNNNVTKIINFVNVHAISLGESVLSFYEVGPSFNPELDARSVSVFVVNPTHAHVQAEAQENWVVELGAPRRLNLSLFYLTHPLNISNFTFNLNLTFTKNLFNITYLNGNGLTFDFLPTQVGITEANFLITSFNTEIEKNIFFKTPLSTTLQIEVVEKIKIFPALMIIPLFNPAFKFFYHFGASGGTGRYVWGSLKESLFIDNMDPAFLAPSSEGLYDIFAYDRMSKFIRNSVKLLTLRVKYIKLTVIFYEIPININFYLNVSLFGYDSFLHKTDVEFTHFSLSFLKLEFNNFKLCENYQSNNNYCLIGIKPGCENIKISLLNYTTDIFTNLKLCTFEPLKIISSQYITIPGSFINVNLTGGPTSILTKRNKNDISINHTDIFNLHSNHIFETDFRIETFKFQCLKPGQDIIYFSSYNSASIPFNYIDKVEFNVECVEPKNLKFVLHPYNNDINCSNRLYVLSQNKNILKFSLYILNNIFIDDLSDFNVIFSSIPTSFIKTSHSIAHLHKNNDLISGEVSIIPNQSSGSAKIILEFKPKNNNYSFSVSFDVKAASYLNLSSKKATILYYSENKRRFKINGGSGVFNIDKNTNIVSVSKNDLFVEISPLRLGFETIKIKDMCCNFPAVNLEISVTTISRVSVIHPIKNLVNKSTEVAVLVFTDLDKLVSNEEQNLISVDFKFFGNKPDEIIKGLNTPEGHIVFNFFTFKPIIIDFVVEVTLIKNKTIVSKKCQIEIYNDVKIIPNEINMVPGLEVQLRTEGGPQVNVESRFLISGHCATFIKSNNSLFSNSVCRETISLEVYGIDSQFNEILYSSYEVPLTISGMTRFEIYSINNKFYQDTTVPVSIKIFNEYGLINPYISISSQYNIEWSVEKSNHITLNFFKQNGLDDKILMLMKEEGSSNIYCKLKYFEYKSSNPIIFTSSKLIYVLRTLNIFSCQQRVILPPNIKYDLKELFLNSFVSFKFAESNHPGFNLESSGILTVPGYPSYSLIIADVKDSRQDISHSEIVTFIVEVSEINELFLVPINQSSHSSLGLDNIRVGAELNLHLRAIDHYGRFFQVIPSSYANITVNPLGIIEVIDFKDSILTIKGVNLGIAYLSLNTRKNINAGSMPLVVNNPFSSQLVNISVGEIISYTFPSSGLSWKFSNPDIVVYSLKDNKIYILTTGIGECDLNIQYKSSFYSVLILKISPSVSIEFSKGISVVSTKVKNYFFDIIINDRSITQNQNITFEYYPFTCSINSNFNHPFKILEGINPESGILSCILTVRDLNSYPDASSDILISAEFKIGDKPYKYKAEKQVSYIPPLNLQNSIKTPISITKCVFEDIKLKTSGVVDDLSVYCDIQCIELDYHVNKNKLTVLSLKLHKCLEKIKSDAQGTIYISRESTNDQILIPFIVKFEEITCLHGPIVTSGILFNSFILFICILISWVIFDRMKIFYAFFYEIFLKIKIFWDVAKKSFTGPSAPKQISPKVCSLKKSDSSMEDGSFSRELYTTRKEFLNSSFKL